MGRARLLSFWVGVCWSEPKLWDFEAFGLWAFSVFGPFGVFRAFSVFSNPCLPRSYSFHHVFLVCYFISSNKSNSHVQYIHSCMMSAKFLIFSTPPPLVSLSHSHNLSVLLSASGQPTHLSAVIICEPLIKFIIHPKMFFIHS